MAAEPVKRGLGRGQEWQDLETQPEKQVVRLDGLVGVGILVQKAMRKTQLQMRTILLSFARLVPWYNREID